MKRVTGIGGIFFKAKDAPALQAWYKRHLAIDVQECGPVSRVGLSHFALVFRHLCGVAVLSCTITTTSFAQMPRNGIGVAAFAASEPALTPLAARLHDTVAVRLSTDKRWLVIHLDSRERPRDPVSGWFIPVYHMVFGEIRRAGGDSLVAMWRCAIVESGQVLASDSVRVSGSSADSVVAALARTVILRPRQRL